jgi:hypothetical protein
VKISSYTYTPNTDSNLNTVYLVATEVKYPTAGSLTPTITTGYGYSFTSGTNQLSAMTISLPVVSGGQNGSGSTYAIAETYDAFGNLTSRTDERGIINAYTIDAVTGQMTQQVLDSGGLALATDYTYDSLDRMVQTLGPSHTVDLSGTATAVQTATWTAYVQTPMPMSAPWPGDQTLTGLTGTRAVIVVSHFASMLYSLSRPL